MITAGLVDDEPACGGRPKDEQGIRGPRTPSFTGTAMAVIVGNELWLGSFLSDRLAYRPLDVARGRPLK